MALERRGSRARGVGWIPRAINGTTFLDARPILAAAVFDQLGPYLRDAPPNISHGDGPLKSRRKRATRHFTHLFLIREHGVAFTRHAPSGQFQAYASRLMGVLFQTSEHIATDELAPLQLDRETQPRLIRIDLFGELVPV